MSAQRKLGKTEFVERMLADRALKKEAKIRAAWDIRSYLITRSIRYTRQEAMRTKQGR